MSERLHSSNAFPNVRKFTAALRNCGITRGAAFRSRKVIDTSKLRNDGLQNQWVLFVRESLNEPGRNLLDPNTLSTDGTVALTETVASHDGSLLVYALSHAGSDWEELRIRDVESGVDLVDRIEWVKFSAISWTPDGKGFFYCRYDPPKAGDEFEGQNYFHKLYYHRIGQSQDKDERIYDRPDRKDWNFRTVVSEDGRYLVIHVWAADESQPGLLQRPAASRASRRIDSGI
jgi:prolyl oligopeptidase